MKSVIFAGTLDYMAPEIANRVVVTKKADIWSLGALVAHLVSPKFRKNAENIREKLDQAIRGTYEISNAASLSAELMELINACLKYDYDARPDVENLKTFAFFNSTDWLKVAACQMEPPFKTNQLTFSHIKNFSVDPSHINVLMTAFQPNKPILESCPEKWRNGSVILKENEIAKGRTGEVPSISPPVCQDPKTMHTPVYIILFLGS
ncbi:unnamed protein product [Hymenolepis diminuta]|uniref:Protein kinase domain-containing protein n=1 Tax=Hymenolepis diminuta TaxID=6216 RepID=A0A564YNF2_HYMDI|nr:unnamed protein product [Hymenolepis diminuta]